MNLRVNGHASMLCDVILFNHKASVQCSTVSFHLSATTTRHLSTEWATLVVGPYISESTIVATPQCINKWFSYQVNKLFMGS